MFDCLFVCLCQGRRIKRKVEEYEYDPVLEPSYRNSMFKLFNKTLDEGYFPLVIVDAVNSKVMCEDCCVCNRSIDVVTDISIHVQVHAC